MDPLQSDIWAHLGHATEPTPAVDGTAPAPAPPTAEGAGEQRANAALRRRFDRGGRRRTDWPEDAGLTCCPGCGFGRLQSLGALDSGDYLWQCPQCDRRFQTGRATRTML